jgi:hypothetical protein
MANLKSASPKSGVRFLGMKRDEQRRTIIAEFLKNLSSPAKRNGAL